MKTIFTDKSIFIIAAVASTLAVVCTPPAVVRSYTLRPEYENANLSGRTVVLELPGEKNIIIENPKDVIDDFGGMNATPQSRIRKFFLPLFAETFKSFLSGDSVMTVGIDHSSGTFDSVSRRDVTLTEGLDSNALTFSIPQKNALQAVGMDSAVVVLIQQLTFKRNNFYVEYYWDDKSRRPANLEVRATVLIWDYKKDTPVFYGSVAQKNEFQIAMQRKHWDESARSLAKKIVLSAKCL